MRPRDYDGPFPKSVFPPSVFPRRIFPWMGGEDEVADDNKQSTPDRQGNNEDKDKDKDK